ncbi:MAG: TIGR02302 family protein [Rhodospirillaceae bacterium]|nr:TIGR02302 family protein [Rhodospirillaceae bacterium]
MVARARWVLRLERAWRALWPLATGLGLALAVALLDVLPLLPPWLHLAILVLAGSGLLAALRHAWRSYRSPSWADAERRVEEASHLAHRPLATLVDVPAGLGPEDPATAALWRAHMARTIARLRALSTGWPRGGVGDEDRVALRGLAVLALGVAVVIAEADWRERLVAAVTPDLAFGGPATPTQIDLFVDPPDYTGDPPVFLTLTVGGGEAATAMPEPLSVPEGSLLTVRLAGAGDTPPLVALGGRDWPMDPLDGGGFEVVAELDTGSGLAISRGGRTLATWDLEVVDDTPPSARIPQMPATTERGALRLSYGGEDDFGLEAMQARVSLDRGALGHAIDPIDAPPVELDLALPDRAPASYDGVAFVDLTPHPWAGLPVVLELTATDALGQIGTSESLRFVLPEREFTHPVARAIVEQRRHLVRDPVASWQSVVAALEEISLQPDQFYGDPVVFLALRTAGQRLRLSGRAEYLANALEPVQRLLWDTALRIEDGDLSLAERALREAQEALREALANGASDEEIARLTEELRQAMQRYLAAAQQQILERMARGELPESLPFDETTQVLDSEALNELLDQLRTLSDAGARDEAMALLDQLQAMMEGLRLSPMAGQGGNSGPAQELLQNFQDLIAGQQALQQEVFDASQQPGQQTRPSASATSQAAAQEGLRRELGELMRELGEMTGNIPQGLGDAELAMRRATGELLQGDLSDASDAQGRAVEQMMRGLGEALADMMSGTGMGAGMQAMPGGTMRTDPFGRPLGNTGPIGTEGVELPSGMDTQRAREILQELRHRLGQRSRPRLELDYLERLLERF